MATPEQWQRLDTWKHTDQYACYILELQARVKALETNSSAALTGSLVDRVHNAINESNQYWGVDARAAIREVALWLHENKGGTTAALMLEQEVNQWVSQKSQKQPSVMY